VNKEPEHLSYGSTKYIVAIFKKKLNRGKKTPRTGNSGAFAKLVVPFKLYLGLSLLRAVDLAMTNLAMQYINYPAKTLMKSSRVVFTMIFGVFITHKKYNITDYAIVLCMVLGLAIFMHADANSSAVFQPVGVGMLTVSLMCDGAITNMSENIMNQYKVGQDEFIFRMYSIALIVIIAAAWAKGDFTEGMVWIMQPGTYEEQQNNTPLEERLWTSTGKISVMILFSSMGFFGSSCAAAITKQFGALSMSITSTARKATTLFLSFLLFDNECTLQHIIGIMVFIFALTTKSIRRKNKKRKGSVKDRCQFPTQNSMDLELGGKGRISRESSLGSFDSSDTIATTSTISSRNGRRKNIALKHSNAKERSPSQRSRYRVV